MEIINILIGIVFLVLGIPIGEWLAKATKEELEAGQLWFKLIIIINLIGGLIGLIIRNDFSMFSFFFIAVVTSRSLKKTGAKTPKRWYEKILDKIDLEKLEEKIMKINKKFENRRFMKKFAGVGFIIIGVLGGFIPIFQGWIFVLLGCAILFGERFIEYIKKIKKEKR